MDKSNIVEFAELWGEAWETTGKNITPGAIKTAFRILSGYAFDAIQRAVDAHLANPDTGQFAPKPADIIRIIDGGTDERAMLAWSKVERAIRRIGSSQSLVFDDSAIHQTIMAMGGWVKLCEVLESDLSYRSHEFCKRYASIQVRDGYTYPRLLAGRAEIENRASGYAAPLPVTIGNPKLCAEVFSGGDDICHEKSISISQALADTNLLN